MTDSYGGVTLLPQFFKNCNDLIRYLLQRSSQVVLPYTLCGSGYRRCRRRTPEPSSPFQVSELETSWPPRNSTREHSLLGHQSRFLVRSSSVTYRGTCYFASVEVTRHTVGGSPSVSGRSAPVCEHDPVSAGRCLSRKSHPQHSCVAWRPVPAVRTCPERQESADTTRRASIHAARRTGQRRPGAIKIRKEYSGRASVCVVQAAENCRARDAATV